MRSDAGRSPRRPVRDSPLLAALELAGMALRVFPCVPNTKRPAIKRNLDAATTDGSMIMRWWDRCPHANVGVATHDLLVLDADSEEALAAVSSLDLPATAAVQTRRGMHFYFRGHVNGACVGSLGPGLDVKANVDGKASGYVVGPGSIVGGHHYRWATHPADVAIATAPDDLLLRVRRRSVAAGTSDSDPVVEGDRNVAITRFAGAAFRHGITAESDLVSVLRAFNAARCLPPLREGEVDAIAASAARTFALSPPWHGLPIEVARWCSDPRLDASAIQTLRCLADHANADGVCWPSQDRLAQLTGVGRNKLRASIAQLEACGRITVERRRLKPNKYRLDALGSTRAEIQHVGIGRDIGSSCTPGGTRDAPRATVRAATTPSPRLSVTPAELGDSPPSRPTRHRRVDDEPRSRRHRHD
jgi:hypothetical protein